MLVKTSGIVLHQIKYSDTSIIAQIYTEYAGRQSFLIQGVRSKSAANKVNLLQPLYILEMEVYHRSGREMQKVKEIKSKIVFKSLPYNPLKTAIALFLTELLYKVLREQEANPNLFSFLENSIEMLDLMEKDFSNFHLEFMMQLSRHLGFYPNNNFDGQKEIFDLQNGYFAEIPPIHPYYLSKELSKMLSELLSSGYNGGQSAKIDNVMRSKLLDKILLYYSLHMTGLDKFHSLDVFREVFHS